MGGGTGSGSSRLGEADYIHNGHEPGDGYGPDVDPVTGDEAETHEPPPHFVLEVHDSRLGARSDFDTD